MCVIYGTYYFVYNRCNIVRIHSCVKDRARAELYRLRIIIAVIVIVDSSHVHRHQSPLIPRYYCIIIAIEPSFHPRFVPGHSRSVITVIVLIILLLLLLIINDYYYYYCSYI